MQREQANFRIDSDAKEKAYIVLQEIGIKPTDAVNMFMRYIAAHGELPFKPRVPNAQTLQSMKDTEKGIGLKHFDSEKEMFDHLDSL